MINVLFEDIFSNNKCFSSYKNLEGAYKITLKKINLKLPKTQLKTAIKLRTLK